MKKKKTMAFDAVSGYGVIFFRTGTCKSRNKSMGV